MVELVYGSFLAALLPVGLHICVRILSAAAGVFVLRDDPPVVLNHHAHLGFPVLSPATGRTEYFKHGH